MICIFTHLWPWSPFDDPYYLWPWHSFDPTHQKMFWIWSVSHLDLDLHLTFPLTSDLWPWPSFGPQKQKMNCFGFWVYFSPCLTLTFIWPPLSTLNFFWSPEKIYFKFAVYPHPLFYLALFMTSDLCHEVGDPGTLVLLFLYQA